MTTNLIQFIFYPFIVADPNNKALFIQVPESYQDPDGGCIIPEKHKPCSMANIFEKVVKFSVKKTETTEATPEVAEPAAEGVSIIGTLVQAVTKGLVYLLTVPSSLSKS
jgi:hypothetical protein